MKRVLVLGAAGAIGRHVVSATLGCSAAGHAIVADRDADAAARIAALHPGRADALTLDLFDDSALRAAVAASDAVLNCAGPFYKTSLPVLAAAIATRKPYLDVCDGWDTTKALIQQDAAAREAGIAAIVGLGGSPGITNLLGRIAAGELDRCDSLVTVAGIDPGPAPDGAASKAPPRSVHWARQIGGTVDIWQDSHAVAVKPLQRIDLNLPRLGTRRFHLIGHPEALTLPRALPGLVSARHALALSKREGALAEALAEGVSAGDITADDAARQIAEPSARPLSLRFAMMWARLMGGFARDLPPFFALATGEKNGRTMRVMAAITRLPPGGAAGAAAAALAVGMELALTHRLDRIGVSPPEAAIDPYIFFEEFASAATPQGTAPGPLIRIERAEGA